MKKVITYGTYDLLHQGHINLLRRAKELGDYLIVGVTSDSFDQERGKLNVRNNVLERIDAVKATGLADAVIIEDYVGQKIDDIQRYDIDIFAIGSDWEGKFDYLNEFCSVVYLPRTAGISSTMLREKSQSVVRIGIVGAGRIARRFVPESKSVSAAEVVAVYDINQTQLQKFSNEFQLFECESFEDLLNISDAIYIASPHASHYEYARKALHANKHVLCEIPFMLSEQEAIELYNYADRHDLIILEANKTAYCPAFNHIITMVKSGVIGQVVDVKASLSKIITSGHRELDKAQSGGAFNEYSPINLMAIIRLLGRDYNKVEFYSKIEHGVDIYTKVNIIYPYATSSITVGAGVKTEGNLVISGTKGYIYVPAPWWLTDYFEIRYENQTENKKFFYNFDGEGLRYEIQEFISMIKAGRKSCYKLRRRDSISISKIIEAFNQGINLSII